MFNMPETSAAMLGRDLEAAGIMYQDEAGKVADFHAFRHTFVSMLVRAGANVKVALELARHSTPTLTFGLYAHAAREDRTAALAALPSLSGLKATSGRQPDGEDDPEIPQDQRLAAPAQRLCDGVGRDESSSGETEDEETNVLDGHKSKGGGALDTEWRGMAEKNESASRRTRTYNPLIKSQLLYQLS
jgi:hypothetical protein